MHPPKKHRLATPDVYLNTVGISDERLRLQASGENPRNAFAKAAFFLSESVINTGDPDLRVHGLALNIVSKLDKFMLSQRTLDAMGEDRSGADFATKDSALDNVIAFNHAIREMIDQHQNLTINEVLDFINQTQFRLTGPIDAAYITNAARIVLNGMRHEIALEQAVGMIPEIADYRGPTIKEEKEAKDIILTMQDGTELYIDSKASLTGENSAMKHGYSKSIPIWTGLTGDDFGQNMRVPLDVVRQKVVPRLRTALRLHDVASQKKYVI